MHDKQIKQTKKFVYQQLSDDTTGHDVYHIRRVYQMALHIGKQIPSCNLFILQIAALLHDSADHKLTDPKIAIEQIDIFLKNISLSDSERAKVLTIIPQISFSAQVPSHHLSIESKIIQDADRLDALGAIGIARTFTYGGSAQQAIATDQDFNAHHIGQNGTSVSHFYDKLFKLPHTLHTLPARKIAEKRVAIMHTFLEQMSEEWQSKDF